MTQISGVSVSPDGRWTAFRADTPSLAANSYRLTWFVAPLGGGASQARRLASGGAPIWDGAGGLVVERPFWSPDSRYLYFRRLGADGVQVWRVDPVSGKEREMTRDAADVRRFRLGGNGRTLIYEAEGASRREIALAERAEYERGIDIDGKVDIAQGLYRAVEINGRLASERLLDPWFTRTNVLGGLAPRVMRLDVTRPSAVRSTGEAFEAGPGELGPDDHDATWSRTGGNLAFVRGWGNDAAVYARIKNAGEAVHCSDPRCAGAETVAWRGESGEVVITVRREDGSGALLGWTPGKARAREIFSAASLGADRGSECAIGGRSAVCVVAAASSPPRLDEIDLDTGASRTLFAPNAKLASAMPVRSRPLEWRLADGRIARGQLFVPPGPGPVPLVINYYDCTGFLKGGTGDEWPFQLFAQAGIAALCIQQLPARPEPGAPLDNVADYQVGLAAVDGAVRELAESGIVDPARVGMGGLSFGSEVAMWTAMNSKLLSAVSIASPTLDAGTYYYFNALPGRDFAEMLKSAWGLGAPDETPARWHQLSAALNTDRLDAPLLMQMPEQEFRYNAKLYSVMLAAGRAADLYAFPNERHIVAQPRHRLAIYERNLDWFRFWLQGIEDPQPGKRNQYDRWKELRARHCSTIGNRKSFCKMPGSSPGTSTSTAS